MFAKMQTDWLKVTELSDALWRMYGQNGMPSIGEWYFCHRLTRRTPFVYAADTNEVIWNEPVCVTPKMYHDQKNTIAQNIVYFFFIG